MLMPAGSFFVACKTRKSKSKKKRMSNPDVKPGLRFAQYTE
jgi:hypothetical protein